LVRKPRPTALFAVNDDMAIGAMAAQHILRPPPASTSTPPGILMPYEIVIRGTTAKLREP